MDVLVQTLLQLHLLLVTLPKSEKSYIILVVYFSLRYYSLNVLEQTVSWIIEMNSSSTST